ncbi:MAG: hypothetical protein JWM76_4853 [Pseudonocardiales bacterium]|nr:hypothetical protein [Pseudonocardiales bacterium]
MQPMISSASHAELDYHRERIAHDLPAGRRGRRLHLGLHRRPRLDVVAPYGDARA